MVVWLFAGGGEAEVIGLVPFLSKHFASTFKRMTPVRRKPGPRPNKHGYGKTGKSLAQQITRQLRNALKQDQHCHLILVIDDLDCRDVIQQTQRFFAAIDNVDGAEHLNRFIGFAAPELEAWLIADWDHTLAYDVDFRAQHEAMRWWLSHEKDVPFDAPETFSYYVPLRDACADKLSAILQNAAITYTDKHYSKAIHTPRLLQQLDIEIVQRKCPLFRELYNFLTDMDARSNKS